MNQDKAKNWRNLEPEENVKFSVEFAKRGLSADTDFYSNDRAALLERRNELRQVANTLMDEMIREPKRADELGVIVDVVASHIGGIQQRLGNLDVFADVDAREKAGSASWRDTQGRAVKVLGKDEPFFFPGSGLGSLAIAVPKNIGLSDIVRGMALGAKDLNVRNALSEGTDAAGGYTTSIALSSKVIDKMRSKSRLIQAGAVTVKLEAQKTNIARVATDPIASWRLENGLVVESEPTFESVQFVARSLAVLVRVSRELLEDSVNLESALMDAFAGSLAVELDRVGLVGTGTDPEPRGLFSTPGVGVVSMGVNGAALANYDKILDLSQTLMDANASEPTAAIMAPRTLITIEKFKDTSNQPLQRPPMLAALPFLDSTNTPLNQTQGTASNASSIFMGDFRELMIGVRSELRIELLRELYAGNHQYGFIAHLRADIQVAKPAALAVLKGITP